MNWHTIYRPWPNPDTPRNDTPYEQALTAALAKARQAAGAWVEWEFDFEAARVRHRSTVAWFRRKGHVQILPVVRTRIWRLRWLGDPPPPVHLTSAQNAEGIVAYITYAKTSAALAVQFGVDKMFFERLLWRTGLQRFKQRWKIATSEEREAMRPEIGAAVGELFKGRALRRKVVTDTQSAQVTRAAYEQERAERRAAYVNALPPSIVTPPVEVVDRRDAVDRLLQDHRWTIPGPWLRELPPEPSEPRPWE